MLGPVKITRDALLPAFVEFLPFARPKQSFERFGPVELPLDEDISHEHALVVIENDEDFCRVDTLQNFAEVAKILEGLASGDKDARLFGQCQLADTLMKQIGFKLGKVDKFGA